MQIMEDSKRHGLKMDDVEQNNANEFGKAIDFTKVIHRDASRYYFS